MEDKDRIEPTEDDVEAHRKKALQANEEGRDEAEGEDDFELHRQKKNVL